MSAASIDELTRALTCESDAGEVADRAFSVEFIDRLAAIPRTSVCPLKRPVDGLRGIVSAEDVDQARAAGLEVIGELPGIYPEWLGDRSFISVHGVRYPYVCGEMANGIATTSMVVEMARAGMLGFFGAAGLDPERVEASIATISTALTSDQAWGVNLIHSPHEAASEDWLAELLLAREVPRISVSAFMDVTPAVVRCSATGLRTDPAGRIVRRTHLFAKISRPEAAAAFMSPAPAELLTALVQRGQLSEQEAALAARVPVAEDITVEADSGGHTDNRPWSRCCPASSRCATRSSASTATRTGSGSARPAGLGTPQSVAAAFALGAAYVVTGSVNQTAVEAGHLGRGQTRCSLTRTSPT